MAERERSKGRDSGDGARGQGPDSTAIRGVILVIVAVCIGVFLLVKGDGSTQSDNAAGGKDAVAASSSTTSAAPSAPATAVPPAQLAILAVNGAGSTDDKLASKTRTTLAAAGYTNVKPADSKPKDAYPQTQVYFLPGFEGDARAVASALGLPVARVVPIPQDPKVASIADAKVVIALGPDAPGAAGQ